MVKNTIVIIVVIIIFIVSIVFILPHFEYDIVTNYESCIRNEVPKAYEYYVNPRLTSVTEYHFNDHCFEGKNCFKYISPLLWNKPNPFDQYVVYHYIIGQNRGEYIIGYFDSPIYREVHSFKKYDEICIPDIMLLKIANTIYLKNEKNISKSRVELSKLKWIDVNKIVFINNKIHIVK